MRVEEWLGKENTLGIDIWKHKYQYDEESFDNWLKRVSGNNKDVEKNINKIYNINKNKGGKYEN